MPPAFVVLNSVGSAARRFRARTGPAAGFTLIELLTTLAIVTILAGLTLGAAHGMKQRAAIGRARAELATLSMALESYKRAYGDYPRTGRVNNAPQGAAAAADGPGILFNALAGKRGPSASLAPMNGRMLIELAQFQLQDPARPPERGVAGQVTNALIDPWGRRYLYSYDPGSTWKSAGFVLYSSGPDGRQRAPEDGAVDRQCEENADNLYTDP